jgi:hypothetical protein
MPTEKAPLNILLTVDDDVRMDHKLPLDPFPHSIPHQDESGMRELWAAEAYDRTFAGMWRY